MRARSLAVLVALMLAAASVVAVDKNNFKSCSDAGFCRRQRDTQATEYHVDASSVALKDGMVSAKVKNMANDVMFDLTVALPASEWTTARVTLRESAPLEPRFEAAPFVVVATPAADGGAEEVSRSGDVVTFAFGGGYHLEMGLSPLTLTWRSASGAAVAVMNGAGMLDYEHTRTKPEAGDELTDAVDAGMWEETWKGTQDPKLHGPQAVACDIGFPAATHVYGIPEHATSLSLPDTRGEGAHYADPYRLYNLDVFEFELDSEMALYGSIPFMMAHGDGHTTAVLWLNAAETWIDVWTEADGSRATHWISEAGIMDVFVFLGDSPRDMLAQYGQLTGNAQMPLYAALGLHYSKWHRFSQEDVMETEALYDEHNTPVDVLVLDIEHEDGKRSFTWDTALFPDPEGMQAALATRGRHITTIADPHLKTDNAYSVYTGARDAGVLVKDHNGQDFKGHCWPGQSSWIDPFTEEGRAYWASQFEIGRNPGATPWLLNWIDMNEASVFSGPEITFPKDVHLGGYESRENHNLYGLLSHAASAQGLVERSQGSTRSFSISRAFFAGSQRHGCVWTGDNEASWEALASTAPMLMSVGTAGLPFVGADVGGFFKSASAELNLRWLQAGAFQPFYRSHGHLDSKLKPPWSFGEPWTSLNREAIRTRYRFLPLLYTVFEEAARNLAPVMRPLWFEYPSDPATYGRDAEWLVGADILVAPVVTEGATQVEAYLPQGRWFALGGDREGTLFPGGQTHTVDAPLSYVPHWIRGGAIVPTKERARRSTKTMAGDPFTLTVALDADQAAHGSLYLDDGHSFDWHNHAAYLRRQFSFADGVLSLAAHPDSGAYETTERIERIRVLGLDANPSAVSLRQGGALTPLHHSWDQATGILVVRNPAILISDDCQILFTL